MAENQQNPKPLWEERLIKLPQKRATSVEKLRMMILAISMRLIV